MGHLSHCCLPDLQRRRLVSATLAAGGLLLVPTSAWAGNIRDLLGEVTINGRKASKKSTVSPGDTISTGAGASVAFVVGRDAYLVKQNSHLELAGGRSETVANVLRLLTGGLLAVFGKGPPRQLQTRILTAGIRGTGIYMEAHPTRTYFCTCYGSVGFEIANSSETKLTVASHHSGGWVNEAPENGSHFGAAEMVGHTDDDLIALEKLVGRVPPFLAPKG